MSEKTFIRAIGLFDATNLVMGSMIGSGIFIVSADIARETGGGGLLLIVWFIAAIMTVFGASAYGELASMFPEAGGQYCFLRETFGKMPAFLYGWTLFLVIQTGTLAAVSVAFAKFLGVLVPWVSSSTLLLYVPDLLFGQSIGFSSEQAVSIMVLILLTANNAAGIAWGKRVQNIFTVIKVFTLFGVIVLGLFLGDGAGFDETFFQMKRQGSDITGLGVVTAVGVAMVGALFSADAWNNVTFAAGEVKNPKITVPNALVLGTIIVTGLYMLCNCAYLNVLTISEIANAQDDRVAATMMREAIGESGTSVMAGLVMVSTFGCLNGMILAGPRLYYAMAKDGLFFSAVGRLGKSAVPTLGLLLQCIWSVILTLSGTYSDLLDYVIFAALMFYALTVAGIFKLRLQRPELPRPYKTPLYPIAPGIYILACLMIMLILLIEKPLYTWPGLLIVLSGVPVYLLRTRFD